MLKKINFILSSIIPQKLYWHLAGLIHPWDSVLEGISEPVKLYKQSSKLIILLKKFKLINKNSAVLDIGCGVGRLEYKLANEVKSCLGIDIAPSMIALAKKHIKSNNVQFRVVGGKDLADLGRKKFDLIFSIIVFQHLPRNIFQNYIKQSYKYLKRRGKLFFQIPTYKNIKPPEPPRNHPWAIRRYSLKELEKILKAAAFKKIGFYNVAGDQLTGKEDQIFVLGIKC